MWGAGFSALVASSFFLAGSGIEAGLGSSTTSDQDASAHFERSEDFETAARYAFWSGIASGVAGGVVWGCRLGNRATAPLDTVNH